jgi:hypothetical protein
MSAIGRVNIFTCYLLTISTFEIESDLFTLLKNERKISEGGRHKPAGC